MKTVYVVTAGSGDTYRIERVYLDSDRGYGFAQDYNGIAPVDPVQVEEWQIGAPPAAYDGPYWRAEWWARVPVAKRRGVLRHTDEGDRFDDFAIRQEWWTGDALPGGQGGAPGIGRGAQDRGSRACPRRRWRNCSGTRSPRSGPTWPECRGNRFPLSLCGRWNETGMATRHCRPCPS